MAVDGGSLGLEHPPVSRLDNFDRPAIVESRGERTMSNYRIWLINELGQIAVTGHYPNSWDEALLLTRTLNEFQDMFHDRPGNNETPIGETPWIFYYCSMEDVT